MDASVMFLPSLIIFSIAGTILNIVEAKREEPFIRYILAAGICITAIITQIVAVIFEAKINGWCVAVLTILVVIAFVCSILKLKDLPRTFTLMSTALIETSFIIMAYNYYSV